MPAGRPTVMTKEVLLKLEQAYLSNATHLEAAIYAGIGEKTLHEYRKEHPEFSQRIDSLKGMTGLIAKTNIRKAVEAESDPDKGVTKSQWWLERRDPEFTPKKESTIDGTLTVKTLLEQLSDDDEPDEETPISDELKE